MSTVADAFEAAYAKETAVDSASAHAQEAANTNVDGGSSPRGDGGREVAGAKAEAGDGVRRRHPLIPAALDAALIRALWTLYKGQFLSAGVIRFFNTSVQFLPAILVQRLLR